MDKKQNYFSAKMASKSTDDLEAIIANKKQYQQDAIQAAIWELESRGNSVLTRQSIPVDKTSNKESLIASSSKSPVDPNAPELYPKWSIWVISALFNPVAGGIMMVMNMRRIGKKNAFLVLLSFTVSYTLLMFVITNSVFGTNSRSLIYFLNFIGAVVLSEGFWNKYIGKKQEYKSRSTLAPFAITIGITILMLWAMFSAVT
ncbi:hypothetical protein [Roseivirga pacifica]|uniref:hypothetical protein n=1 Tax=Roseivirga pacifica TaxID=1267423 RepID=UPI00227D00CE|nr:hypothetical protein [Roseivirga pacifica]